MRAMEKRQRADEHFHPHLAVTHLATLFSTHLLNHLSSICLLFRLRHSRTFLCNVQRATCPGNLPQCNCDKYRPGRDYWPQNLAQKPQSLNRGEGMYSFLRWLRILHVLRQI